MKESTIEYYNKNAGAYYNNTVFVDMSKIYKVFLAKIKPKGRILDAGCGSGRDTLFFLKNGYEVVAFDASIEMVTKSTKLTGQKTWHMTFENVHFNTFFDGIWACASLLHVSRKEIVSVVNKLSYYLLPNGIFYMSFKYGNTEYVKDGRYFLCFNENAFRNMIDNTDLEIISVYKTEDVRKERKKEQWLNCLLRKPIRP